MVSIEMRELRTFRPNSNLVPERVNQFANYNVIAQETEEPNNATCKETIRSSVPNMYCQAEVHEEPQYATIKRHQRYKTQRLKNVNRKEETSILKIPMDNHRVKFEEISLDDTNHKDDILKRDTNNLVRNTNVKIDQKKGTMTRSQKIRRACWLIFSVIMIAATISIICMLQSMIGSPVLEEEEVKNVTSPSAARLPPELRQLLTERTLWPAQPESTQQPGHQSTLHQKQLAAAHTDHHLGEQLPAVHTDHHLEEQLPAAHNDHHLTMPAEHDTERTRDRELKEEDEDIEKIHIDIQSDDDEKEEKENNDMDSDNEGDNNKIISTQNPLLDFQW